MKKSISAVSFILCLSIMLHITGVSAATISYLVNFKVLAFSNGTKVDTLTKTVDGPQRLYVSSYFNRNLVARIVARNSIGGYNGDSRYYWTISIKDGFNTSYLGVDQRAQASAYAWYQGDKDLYFKTSGYWLDSTSVSGQWYVNG